MLYKKTPRVCRAKFKYSYFHTRRKMDIHIQLYSTELYKGSVTNMVTKLYNKLPGYIKDIDSYKTFKKEMNHFFFCIPFTQWKNL